MRRPPLTPPKEGNMDVKKQSTRLLVTPSLKYSTYSLLPMA